MLGTYGATLVGMVYAFLPLSSIPIYTALQPVDRRLIEADGSLGAGPAETFFRVTLPLSLPGVLAAALFVFVPSMGVFAIPVLLGGGKDIILGNLIVQLFLEFRNIPLGAAMSICCWPSPAWACSCMPRPALDAGHEMIQHAH